MRRRLTAHLCAFVIATTALVAPAAQAEVAQPIQDKQYVLRFGDSLNLKVVENEKLTIEDQPIRPDGRVSMPLIGEIQAGGLTLPQLTERITKSYGKFFVDPHVVVNVAKFRPLDINIVGQVNRPGTYQVAAPVRLLNAIGLGGGFDNFRADLTNVVILRQNGSFQRIDLNEVLNGKVELNVMVYDGDTIRVGEVAHPDFRTLVPSVASVISALGTILIVWRR
jgi:polysaccharide export outer membrane protein